MTTKIGADLRRHIGAAVADLGGPIAAARRLGVTTECVRWWLRGRSAPGPRAAEKLAELTGRCAAALRR